ncbi:MAG TPA: endonuclease/exonuclease/phosphatase family protein [Candidatus Saccharimonadales bacterium]|nr:endonuclease/exonuclease/phosphatase family protein [Candidatus Saccharimonadales bacterium]
MKITFGSLNVQAFADWNTRKQRIVDYVKQSNLDIILFQEVTFLPQINAENQVSLLNKELRYPYENSAVTRLQASPHFENYREGLGLLSKWPILKSETFILKQKQGDEHQRIVQLVDVLYKDEIIKFANVHFSISDNDESFPREHLQELLEVLKTRNETRIIGGDFNMNSIDLHADLWQGDYLSSSVKPYVTYPALNKRVDYFLVPKEYAFLNIATSPDGLSDHRGLIVEMEKNAQVAAPAKEVAYQAV